MTTPATTPATGGLLLVHAHPDDESINNGATMALYAARGVPVTLVTCTRGELGEVIPPELAHHAADAEGTLGAHREDELAAAMAALGVTDHRFLDQVFPADFAPALFHDSGMAWGEDGLAVAAPETGPDAFARADRDDAAARLAAVLRETRPRAVVTYEPGGGYGHPDHVMAHDVTMRAVELARSSGPGGAPFDVPKLYWITVPRRTAVELMAALEAAGENPFEAWAGGGPLPSMFVDDALVTTRIDGTAHLEAKVAALRAHASQIAVDGPFFALSNGVGQPMMTEEFYQLAHGDVAGPRDADGRETDLLA